MLVLFIIIGMCLGSFYHVLANRLSNDKSIIKPASHCEHCNKKLKWYELIPVVSYLVQRGKCNNCHKKISFSYIIIEIFLGIAFGIGYYLYNFSYELYAYLIIVSLLSIIFISDFKYLVILDIPLFVGIILILVLKYFYFGFMPALYALISGLILFGFLLFVKLLGDKVFMRESLGWGDVKLSLFMGVTLGIKLGLFSLILGSLIAMPYALFYIMKKEAKEIPYGPFLILAVFITFIYMLEISDFINFFFMIHN